jgi:hypothetical protein
MEKREKGANAAIIREQYKNSTEGRGERRDASIDDEREGKYNNHPRITQEWREWMAAGAPEKAAKRQL